MKRFILFIISILMATKKTKEQQTVKQNNVLENYFKIDIPKKDDAGEDAPPLLVVSDSQQRCVVGVFDGMGGSGSKQYEENGEIHTGAYLASRVTKNTVEQFFRERLNVESVELVEKDKDTLKNSIINGLKEKLSKQQYEQSKIKSSLIRTFPTTMAVGVVSQHDKNMKIKLLWAGDSRIYFLSSEKGLVQLTKDDLKLDNDPFQNIENDSPLSNMINLDTDFSLNYKEIPAISPAIVFAATDGCFGYYPTPIHFEDLLLQSMQDADSMEEWKQKITENLKKISGDDFSLSLVCFAYDNFNQLKSMFQKRIKSFYDDFMNGISDIERKVIDAKQQEEEIKEKVAQYEKERIEIYETSWNRYKIDNYSLFNTDAK